MVKDYFSDVASDYQYFRPSNVPLEFFNELISYLQNRDAAYDCATGNGQFANHLVNYFPKVYASDLSIEQIKHAKKILK